MTCPKCGSEYVRTERRPNGDTQCLVCNYKAKTNTFLKTTHQQRLDKVLSKFDKVNNNIWFSDVCVEYMQGKFMLDQDFEISLDTVEHLIKDLEGSNE